MLSQTVVEPSSNDHWQHTTHASHGPQYVWVCGIVSYSQTEQCRDCSVTLAEGHLSLPVAVPSHQTVAAVARYYSVPTHACTLQALNELLAAGAPRVLLLSDGQPCNSTLSSAASHYCPM